VTIDHYGDEANSYDETALFSVSVFDDADCELVRDVANRVFARDSTLRIKQVHFVLQELLIMYSCGRTTGLVVNMGHDLTILGVYEGLMLGETARRVPMTASEVCRRRAQIRNMWLSRDQSAEAFL
jgi:hypothetical protein